MAVRRISDLPNLVTYYQDADLNDTLIEVSYAKPVDPRRYQSFYVKLSDIVKLISNALPRATKTDFGIVRIGDNIDVVSAETADKGLISVPTASRSKPGVVQIGSGIDVDSNGVISVNSVGYASTTSPGIVRIGTNINVDPSTGLISIPTATTTSLGVVKVQNGNGLSITDGTISMTQQSTAINVQPLIDDGIPIATITANNTNYVIKQKSVFNSADIDYFNTTNKCITIKIPGMASGSGSLPILNLRIPFDCWVRISKGSTDGPESESSSHQIYSKIKKITKTNGYYLEVEKSFNAGQFMFFAKANSRYFIQGKHHTYTAASNFLNSRAVYVRLYPLIDGNSTAWNINDDVKMICQLKAGIDPAHPYSYVRYTVDGEAYYRNPSGTRTTDIGQAQRYFAPLWDTDPTDDPIPIQ